MEDTEALDGWKPQHNTCIWDHAQLLESEPFGLERLPALKHSIDAQIATMRFYLILHGMCGYQKGGGKVLKWLHYLDSNIRLRTKKYFKYLSPIRIWHRNVFL